MIYVLRLMMEGGVFLSLNPVVIPTNTKLHRFWFHTSLSHEVTQRQMIIILCLWHFFSLGCERLQFCRFSPSLFLLTLNSPQSFLNNLEISGHMFILILLIYEN